MGRYSTQPDVRGWEKSWPRRAWKERKDSGLCKRVEGMGKAVWDRGPGGTKACRGKCGKGVAFVQRVQQVHEKGCSGG